MKIQITMKTPDALENAIRKAVEEESRVELLDIARKWFRYGEYLTVEIDTEAKTCTVLEAK